MENYSETHNEEKTGDTANTVPINDCNSSRSVSTLKKDALPAPVLKLIDILARQAAREICGTNEGE